MRERTGTRAPDPKAKPQYFAFPQNLQHMFIPILQQGRMMLTFVCCRVCVCVRWTLAAVCVCVFVNHVGALDVVEMQLGFVFK